MKRPDFVPVVPDEVEEYGANAALVLSLIRFRCEVDGDDRINREGVRWWEVSHNGIGQQVGLSVKAVRRALERLGDRVSAKYLAKEGGHPNAYRINDTVTSSSPVRAPSDQQLAHLGTPCPNGVGGPTQMGGTPYPKRTNSPIYQESKKGEEAAVSTADKPEPVKQHQSSNAPPPEDSSEEEPPFHLTASGKVVCAKHVGTEGTDPCWPCGEARKAYEANRAAEAEAERARRTNVRVQCTQCDPAGWRLDHGGRDGDTPKKCDHKQAS